MERRGLAVALSLAAGMLLGETSVRADLAKLGSVAGIHGGGLSTVSDNTRPAAEHPRSSLDWDILQGRSRALDGSFSAEVKAERIELAFEAPAGGKVKLIARRNFSPLVDEAGLDGGPFTTIMTRALENAGYEPSLGFAGDDGAADDLRGVNFPHPHDPAGKTNSIYSIPIISMRALASVRADTGIVVNGVVDLAGLTVCADEVVLDLALRAAEKAGVIGVKGVSKHVVACFNDLLNGNLDAVLVEPEQNAFVTERPEISRLLTTRDSPVELGTLHATMPRFSPYSSSMMYHLNNALTEMIQSGEVNAIISESRAKRVSAEGGPLLLAPTPVEDDASVEERREGRSEPLKGATM